MNIIKALRRFSLKNKDITIFTNNCLAGFIYQSYGLKYSSPTIGINIEPMDFIKFCKNYEYYLNQEIFETKEYNQDWFYSIGGGNINFPVGKLGDITLYFQHANSFEEAVKDWNRRKKRVNYNNIFIILFDTEPTDLVYNAFKEINSKNKLYLYHKGIILTDPNTFYIKNFEKTGRKWWGRMNRLNPFSKKYFEQFNYTKWFNTNC